jgi:elongation factor P
MATLGLNDVKTGKKIIHNGDPWIITEADFVKPGKGQAFTRIRIRNLKDGRTTEQTLKSSDSFEEADATDTDMQLSLHRRHRQGSRVELHADGNLRDAQAPLAAMGDAGSGSRVRKSAWSPCSTAASSPCRRRSSSS